MALRPDEIPLRDSILVVAHPDDEILWFSSILTQVRAVLFCFLPCPSNSTLTDGRRKTLAEYPIGSVSCLGLDEAEVFSPRNFVHPVPTDYGLEIVAQTSNGGRYVTNYGILRDRLRQVLTGHTKVVTHNPWGEYGNEEHIQVYRVVRELQRDLHFSLWFTNYCSNRSFELMCRYGGGSYFETGSHSTRRASIGCLFRALAATLVHSGSGRDRTGKTLETSKELARQIAGLYKKNECWTWYNNWQWFDRECFIREGFARNSITGKKPRYPLNFIYMRFPGESPSRGKLFRLFASMAGRNMAPRR